MANRLLPLLVTPQDLDDALGEPGLLIVDLANPDVYAAGHIPGAVSLGYGSLLRQQPPAMGLLPDEEQLSRVLSGIGLRSDLHVVAYDNEGNGRASRLLWSLEAVGHFSYSLLDGGLTAWRAENRRLEQGENPPEPSAYRASISNPDVLADRDYVLGHLGDANTVVLDARSPAEYTGEDVRAARGGHIPGAVNLEWTQLMDRAHELRLQPTETLRTMLKQAGVTPDKEVITHCQTHHRSALTFFVMRYLGYPRIRGYAGSWSEWGNDPELPAESGAS